MTGNNFDQTLIETAIGNAIRAAGVSANVFHNRPRSMVADLEDFVVVKVSGPVSDLAAFGKCVVSAHLFARDVANMKNGKKLSVMQTKLRNGLTAEVGNIVLDVRGIEPIGDTPDGNGYHVRIVQMKNIILKIA